MTGGAGMTEIRPGYKQTVAGLIPEDWQYATYGELFDFLRTANNSRADLVESGDMLYIHYGDIHTKWDFTLDFDKEVIPQICSEKVGNVDLLQTGDLILADASEDEMGAGKSIEVVNLRDRIAISGLHTLLLRSKNDRLANGFKGYIQSIPSIQIAIRRIITGLKVFGISKTSLRNVYIPLPSLVEQRAIAAALSDVDGLLTALAELIAKKRAIKQAAMQQLLTGQTRLPGFSGEWRVRRLGDVAEIIMGQSPSSTYYNVKGNGIPLIQGNADVDNRITIVRVFTTQITKRCVTGDIIMSVRAPVGQISLSAFEACLGRGVCAIRFPNNYLYHLLIFMEDNWAKISKGSTFDSVSSDDIINFEILLPTNLEEQLAIAALLSDMDVEISALEAQRAKVQALKQGMLQELLTGRTRLV
jgi:type I restriction enzyme S subunit